MAWCTRCKVAAAINGPRTRRPSATRLTLRLGLGLSLGLALAWNVGIGRAAEPRPRSFPATATLRFDGTSTLHDFGGTLSCQPFTLTVSSDTWSASGEVLSGAMNTQHEKRDRKMHEMFATNAFPKLRGGVTNAAVPGPNAEATAQLALQIRDRTNTVPVKISRWVETPDAIRFEAAWAVSLRQYGLQPPSVLGVIRVGDTVQVRAEVVAAKTKAAPPTQPARPPATP